MHPRPATLPSLALVFSLASLPLAAQGAAGAHGREGPASSPTPHYVVDHWGLEDGLPSEFIRDLVQTSDGYLWMISGGQLVRFDGLSFTTFQGGTPGDPLGIPGGLAAGRGDTLWIVQGSTTGKPAQSTAEGGLARSRGAIIARADGRFIVRADLPTTDSGVSWRSIAQSPTTGRLWVHSSSRLSEWTSHGLRLRYRGSLANGVEGGDWRPQVAFDRWGTLWVQDGSTHVAGPLRDGHVEPLGNAAGRVLVTRPSTGEVLATRKRHGRLEVVDDHGRVVASCPAGSGRIPRVVDRDGRLWVTAPDGVEVYDRRHRAPVAVVKLPASVVVDRMLEDREGDLWLGTATSGIFRIRTAPFRTYSLGEGIATRQVRSVSSGGGDDVLVVDALGNLYRIHDGTVARVHPGPPPPGIRGRDEEVSAALVDSRGTLWMSVTDRAGASYLVGRRPDGRRLVLEMPEAAGRIVEDRRRGGVLWVATDHGLFEVEPYGAGGPRLLARFLRDRQIHDVLVGRRGNVWVSTFSGLVRIAGGKAETVPGSFRAPPRALWQDADGDLWIGTNGGGLVRYRDGTMRTVTMADGLADNVVSSIMDDGAGNLWMGGNRYIQRVALADLQAFLAGRKKRVDGVGYDRHDGLVSPEGSGEPGYRAPDGRLWFPTFGGAAVVDPAAAIAADRVPPLVHIDALEVDGAPVPDTGRLRLETGRRNVEVLYDAVSLRNPDAVRFEHRLVGFDPHWIGPGSSRSATYTNLPPGRYTFRVRARNGGGVWSTNEASVSFVVPPLFRETVWFYLLCAAGFVALVWGVFTLRNRALRARQVDLEHQVDERTRELTREKERTEEALATVAAQAEQLRSLDEAKSRFFANVSHEFRTPLSLILGPLRDLEGDAELRGESRKRVGIVLRSGERLVRLVDQLLDAARLEAGALKLEPSVADIVPLLRGIAGSFQAVAEARERRFDIDLPEGPVWVSFDAEPIEKVVTNLLANAFKFTEAGGRVWLRACVEEDGREGAGHGEGTLALRVEDDGPGVPPEDRERIFERFHQVDASSSRSHEGVGLGLSLSRELVELHGGEITVGDSPAGGASFRVTLPLVEGHHALEATERAGGESEVPEAAAERDAAPGAASGSLLDQPVALLAEDNPDLRAWVRRHLEARYRVVEAPDGRKALEMARSLVPDVVVSDVMMPGIDGEELCRAIKADPELHFVPVILLTARAARADRLSGLRSGADGYLSKPFDIQELMLLIDNVAATRRNLRERAASVGLPPVRPPWEGRPVDDPGRAFLDHLYRRLAEHLSDEDLTIELLAEAMGMSRSTLYRRIDELLDEPPMEVIWAFRLEQAASWLRDTDVDVAEVAFGVGFKTVSHFSRRFRDRFGAPPSAWRAAQRRD